MTSTVGIKRENLFGPSDLVGDALALRLRDRPQFEVPQPIVIADTVEMMDLFLDQERTSEVGCHNHMVFSCPTLLVGVRSADANLDENVTARVLTLGADWKHGTDQPDGNVGLNVASANAPRVMRATESGDGCWSFASSGRADRAMVRGSSDRDVCPDVTPTDKAGVVSGAMSSLLGRTVAAQHQAEPTGSPHPWLQGQLSKYIAMGLEASVMTRAELPCGQSPAGFDGTGPPDSHTALYKAKRGRKATVLGADL